MGYYLDNPDPTGEPIYVEGDRPELGNTNVGVHQPWTTQALRTARYLAPAFGVATLDAFLNPAVASGFQGGATAPTIAPTSSAVLPPALQSGTAVSLGAAPTAAAVGGGSAAAGGSVAAGGGTAATGGSMSPWLKEILRIGGDVGANLINRQIENSAVTNANKAQQAGTDQALRRLDQSNRINADVYNQQRQDYQGLANAPFQTLGGLLGIPIPAIAPMASAAAVTDAPPGFPPAGRIRGTGGPPGGGMAPPGSALTPPAPVARQAPVAAPEQRATLQTLSSYAAPRGGAGDTIPVTLRDGRTVMIPASALPRG